MRIWIRSQNREKIVNTDIFETAFMGERTLKEPIYTYYICACFEDRRIVVGTYSTKEKALKVLDMIQKHISNINYFEDIRIGADYSGVIATPNYKVFQMPQDDEV